jgi:CHAT domain-containing protein
MAERACAEYRSKPEWGPRFCLLEAEVLVWQGKNKVALALIEQHAPSFAASSELLAKQKCLQSISNSYLQNLELAERQAREAEQIASTAAPARLADVYLSWGTLERTRGNYEASEKYFSRTLELARAQGNDFLKTAALGNLGVANMRLHHYDKAIDLFTEVSEIAQRHHNAMLLEKNQGNLGWCYLSLGNYDRAEALFSDAAATAAKLGMARDQQVWLNSLGLIRENQRDYAEAEKDLQQALAIARKLENREATAMCLSNLALTAIDTRQFDAAERYNDESLALNRGDKDRSEELYNLKNRAAILAGRGEFADAEKLLRETVRDAAGNASLRWECETELALIYARQGQDSKADAAFRLALGAIDRARASIVSSEYRLTFLATARDFYDAYIDYLVRHGRARDALRVAEHSRARTLAEGLGMSDELRDAAFQPEQAAAREQAVILYYWLKPERSYLWTVTRAGVDVHALPAARTIDDAVQAYRKVVLGPRDPRETQDGSGQSLFQTLVAPASKALHPGGRVIVVADGSLHSLNFETLLAPAPQPHYWIEDAVLSNAPSIGLLSLARRGRAPAGGRLLLVGDPVSANADFPPLAQAKQELKIVSRHFREEQRTVLEGGAATAHAYLASDTGGYSYLHFVTHGTASRTAPLESSIILSPEAGNFKLYARDIMSKPLHADLVTISACYGAGTRAYTGEGLVGLSWAFLRAGSHSVIASLWEVNDASTPQLMDGLYDSLDKGYAPSTALRAAKLAMLRSGTVYRRPYYWAAFQLYGGT